MVRRMRTVAVAFAARAIVTPCTSLWASSVTVRRAAGSKQAWRCPNRKHSCRSVGKHSTNIAPEWRNRPATLAGTDQQGRIIRRDVLGKLLHAYARQAA